MKNQDLVAIIIRDMLIELDMLDKSMVYLRNQLEELIDELNINEECGGEL